MYIKITRVTRVKVESLKDKGENLCLESWGCKLIISSVLIKEKEM